MTQLKNDMTIEQRLTDLVDQAHDACGTDKTSNDCATAWEAVEEVQAEIADRRVSEVKTPLTTYCDTHPDAAECRIYDV